MRKYFATARPDYLFNELFSHKSRGMTDIEAEKLKLIEI